MVAFATNHESGTATVTPKNRVGNFFVDVPDCIGTTGPQTRTVAGENDRFSYDACRGVSLALGGDEGGGTPFTLAAGFSTSGAVGLRGSVSYQYTFSYSGGSRLSLQNYRIGHLANATPLTGVSTSASGSVTFVGSLSGASAPEELSGRALNLGAAGGQVVSLGYNIGNLGSDGPVVHNVSLGLGTHNFLGIPTLPAEAYAGAEFTHGASIPVSEVVDKAIQKTIEYQPKPIITGFWIGF